MRRASKLSPVLRAVGVISAVAVLVSGVTFAALTSQATLTGNTISSATAGLLVDGPDEEIVPTASEAGFGFAGLIPGGEYSATGTTKQFRLKNSGSAPLDVSVQATNGTPTNINKSLVNVKITNDSETGDPFVVYTLTELESGLNSLPGVSGTGSLDTAAGGEQDIFDIQVQLLPGAVTGDGGNVGSFNLVFTGTSGTVAP